MLAIAASIKWGSSLCNLLFIVLWVRTALTDQASAVLTRMLTSPRYLYLVMNANAARSSWAHDSAPGALHLALCADFRHARPCETHESHTETGPAIGEEPRRDLRRRLGWPTSFRAAPILQPWAALAAVPLPDGEPVRRRT